MTAAKKSDANKENEPATDIADEPVTEAMKLAILARKKITTFKVLMRRAGMPHSQRTKHLHHLEHMNASESLPMGRVSNSIYDDITNARTFDRYGRMVSTKLSGKAQMISDLQATLTNQGGDAAADKSGRPNTLKSSLDTIGYKAERFGPPGLQRPLGGELNSEGNEHFFSYDGSWRDGEMNGYGTYRYADGMKYIGMFKDGRPHGDGVAEYPGGVRYTGSWAVGWYDGYGQMEYSNGIDYTGMWKKGKRHGQGKLTYPSGATYDGNFMAGLQHGRATVKSAQTGFEFTGTFDRGFINGAGRVTWPDGRTDTRDFTSLQDGMTLKGLVELLHAEKQDATQLRTEQRDETFSVRLAVRLVDHVEQVRQDIREDRKAERAIEDEKRRALMREQREKQKQARIASLAAAADARAEEDVLAVPE